MEKPERIALMCRKPELKKKARERERKKMAVAGRGGGGKFPMGSIVLTATKHCSLLKKKKKK